MWNCIKNPYCFFLTSLLHLVGVRSLSFLGRCGDEAFPLRWQLHLLAAVQWSCCCCSPTTLEANRRVTSARPRASRTCSSPLWFYLAEAIITNTSTLLELISPLCSSSGRGGDGALPLTAQIKKKKTEKLRLYRTFPPRLAEPLVRVSDWLVEAEWSFLPLALTSCHFTVCICSREGSDSDLST